MKKAEWGELVASFKCILFPGVKWWQFWKPCSMTLHSDSWGFAYTFFYKWGFKTTIVQPRLKIHFSYIDDVLINKKRKLREKK